MNWTKYWQLMEALENWSELRASAERDDERYSSGDIDPEEWITGIDKQELREMGVRW